MKRIRFANLTPLFVLTPLFLLTPSDIIPRGGQGVIAFVVILLALVVIHEFGHFLAAKAFGVKVLEFGVGFPPKIKGWQFGETEYTINWLPIGGFVRLLGEEDPSDPKSLAAASRPTRLAIMFAGVFMNLVLAVLLLSVGYMIPRDRALSLAQVTDVATDSPAYCADVTGEMRDGTAPASGLSEGSQATKSERCKLLYGNSGAQGLQSGDIIQEVNGRDVKNVSELIYQNRLNLGETQTWTITRAGSTLTAKVYARWHPPANEGPTGIRVGFPSRCVASDAEGECTEVEALYPFVESVKYNPIVAIGKGAQGLWETIILTKNEIRVRVGGGGGGGVPDDQPAFSGPVGIADQTADLVSDQGWRPLIELAALLSLNLAVFNVLPIPMLDGGRILFVLIEIVRGGRRISPEKEGLVHMVGFALMMAGVVVVTFFDVARIVS